MKRFACHRLYQDTKGYLPQAVIAIDDCGKVKSFFPLEEELKHTEWIGGVVILSNHTIISYHSDFQYLLQTLISSEEEPLYAWHISNFDFQNNALTPRSIIKRLS